MKKILLLTAATMIAASSFAQNSVKNNAGFKKVDLGLEKAELALENLNSPVVKKAPRKGLPEGLYFKRPEGTLYTGITDAGQQRYISALIVPPGYNLKFTNMSSNKAQTNWTINNNPADARFVDADFNFFYGGPLPTAYSNSAYYTPVLHRGTQKYQLGESGSYFTQGGGQSFVAIDTITNLSLFDTMTAKNFGLGSFYYHKGQRDSINYIYGTGEVTLNDGSIIKNLGVIQYVPAFVAPLCVEDYHFIVLSSDENPIAPNAKLKMVILSASKDSEGKWELGTDTIAKLEAGAEDLSVISPVQQGQGGRLLGVFNLKFHKKEIDPLSGTLGNVPFIIEGPHAMVITGFQDQGIKLGFRASEQVIEDAFNMPSHAILQGADGQVYSREVYGDDMTLFFSIKGGFDYVEPSSTLYLSDGTQLNDMNVLHVSNDGQTVNTEGKTGGQDLGGAMVYTAFPYNDAQGNPNYFVGEKPEWVTDIDATEYTNKDPQDRSNIVIAKPICDPLPSGVQKRVGVVYLQGKTGKSKTPIIVLQGNATIADGIENIEAEKANKVKNGNIYNLSGQQVGKDYKGIIIKDGKKLINK